MNEKKDGGKYSDPDLEKFFRDNRRMVERIIKEEKEILLETAKAEKAKAEECAKEQSERVRGVAADVFAIINDPEVQKHFTAVGIELLLGMNALLQASPIPDNLKDFASNAEHRARQSAESAKKASGEAKTEPEKVDIDVAPKKRKTTKPKTDE
ncbi:MAG: hypothetical protein LBS92_05710 [Candidatus Methanoplasma sp.]|jgi:hypothetical protein|nr:hypothetical protein [Candidatus Methanoplasma sp.]